MDSAEKLLWNYAGDDSAVTAIEYGMIAAIIAIAILTTVVQIGLNLQVIFGDAASF